MRKLGLAGLVVCAALAAAPSAFASHSWGGYHWARTANPFNLTLEDHVTSPWKTYLNGAASDWSAKGTVSDYYSGTYTANSPVTETVQPNLGTDRRCRPASGRVKVCDASYGYNGWLGLASIWASGGHISQGTVKLNDSYYSSGSFYDNAVWRAAVVCQETGHTIGLDHQDESGANFHTCMDYASSPNFFNEHPNRDDYDELRGGGPSSGFHTVVFGGVVGSAIYTSHRDSSNSATLQTSAKGSAKRVRDDLFVQDLKGGGKRFIFVFWKKPGGHHTAPDEG